MTTQPQLNIAAISEAAVKMIKEKCLSSFSLCSIGSGNGRFDNLVLKNIQSHYPTINLNYLGVDLNKMSCQTAESNLKSFNNLTFRILNCDAQTMDTTGLEGTYDMVILIHTIIYMTSPNDCLMKCRELIKPNG
jgi:2-polyprenyl-3-methyl-5-hydroxy-6-metoxy-1,4-benzoquinol methylase